MSSIAALGFGGGFSLLLATGAVASLLCSRRSFFVNFEKHFGIIFINFLIMQEEIEEGGQHGQKLP